MTQAQTDALAKAHELLGEHFDIGQISLTWEENHRTFSIHLGWGNVHARTNMVSDLLCSNFSISSDIYNAQAEVED